KTFGSTDVDPGDRFFYEVRNKVWMFKDRAPLAPLERAAYGGSTLRRWARTFAHARDRRTLGSALARGISAGMRTRPRPNAEVRAGAGLLVPARGQDGRPRLTARLAAPGASADRPPLHGTPG